jgi:hypothetical protein
MSEVYTRGSAGGEGKRFPLLGVGGGGSGMGRGGAWRGTEVAGRGNTSGSGWERLVSTRSPQGKARELCWSRSVRVDDDVPTSDGPPARGAPTEGRDVASVLVSLAGCTARPTPCCEGSLTVRTPHRGSSASNSVRVSKDSAWCPVGPAGRARVHRVRAARLGSRRHRRLRPFVRSVESRTEPLDSLTLAMV